MAILDGNISLPGLMAETRFSLGLLSHYRGGVEWSGQWRNDARQGVPTVYCVFGGDGEVRDGGLVTPLQVGYMYLLPPKAVFRLGCHTHMDKVWFRFQWELEPQVDVFDYWPSLIELGPMSPPDRQEILAACEEGLTLKSRMYIQGLTFNRLVDKVSVIETCLERYRSGRRKFGGLLGYIDEHLDARLTVSELAHREGMKLSALSKSFKRAAGISLKDYINGKLNARARDLLQFDRASIRDIAKQLGFRDEYYFSRFFKKQNDLPPSMFRRWMRGEIDSPYRQ